MACSVRLVDALFSISLSALIQGVLVSDIWHTISAEAVEARRRLPFTYWVHVKHYAGKGNGILVSNTWTNCAYFIFLFVFLFCICEHYILVFCLITSVPRSIYASVVNCLNNAIVIPRADVCQLDLHYKWLVNAYFYHTVVLMIMSLHFSGKSFCSSSIFAFIYFSFSFFSLFLL